MRPKPGSHKTGNSGRRKFFRGKRSATQSMALEQKFMQAQNDRVGFLLVESMLGGMKRRVDTKFPFRDFLQFQGGGIRTLNQILENSRVPPITEEEMLTLFKQMWKKQWNEEYDEKTHGQRKLPF